MKKIFSVICLIFSMTLFSDENNQQQEFVQEKWMHDGPLSIYRLYFTDRSDSPQALVLLKKKCRERGSSHVKVESGQYYWCFNTDVQIAAATDLFTPSLLQAKIELRQRLYDDGYQFYRKACIENEWFILPQSNDNCGIMVKVMSDPDGKMTEQDIIGLGYLVRRALASKRYGTFQAGDLTFQMEECNDNLSVHRRLPRRLADRVEV